LEDSSARADSLVRFFVKTFAYFELPRDVEWETSSGERMPPTDTYSVALLLEYMEGGTLFNAIRYENEEKSRLLDLDRFIKYRVWAAEVAKAMQFLHELDIVHRDLKPDNVMLKPMPLKRRSFACIGDWGFAKNTELDGVAESNAGEACFAAPEIPKLKTLEEWKPYTPHCDVFSFGKVMKALFACTLKESDISSPGAPVDFPESAKTLVEKTTIELPATSRGTFEEICAHAFFGEVTFGDNTVPAIDFERLVQDARAAR